MQRIELSEGHEELTRPTTVEVSWVAARGARVELLREVSGGFGDVGLLAPLAIALITINHLNATAVLVGAGLFYLVTAVVFRLPVPVQPLKSVSAVAIATGINAEGIAAAGLIMGAIFVVLALTRAASVLQRLFVPSVVRGIQLSIGLLLAKAALDMVLRQQQLTITTGLLEVGGLSAGVVVGLAVLVALMLFEERGTAGGPLMLLGAGLALGIVAGVHAPLRLALGPQPVVAELPSAARFGAVFWTLVVPQVGLSVGNSLMATSATARQYFGERGARVTPTRLALSMGLANLVVSLFGGMPMCHGAGGMTAHVRTGARRGLGIAVYGLVLVGLGLGLGTSAVNLLGLLPPAVLGGFLLYVGIEHGALLADLRNHREFVIAATVAALAVSTGNISVGAIGGIALHLLLCWQAPRSEGSRVGTAEPHWTSFT